ncbi:subtilase-type protease inhibitor [Streptomyces rimosus]|uniref:subtilase-type protease inhibitor n=1 Tax=Streptomyces rimosus TaxID=1927 RepID=UPI0004C8C4CE|nr:subtilase-type protease inhibitor [Streptomyces rimosus]
MRYITGGIALGAALALGGLATTAEAQPATPKSLYAPSELVLTVGYGDTAATASIQRAVSLSCSSAGTGTHPMARAACAELRTANGDFNKITKAASDRMCTKEYNPVVVTANGVWQGRRVAYEHTFANPCALEGGKGLVFEF